MNQPDGYNASSSGYARGHSEEELERMHSEAVAMNSVVVGHLQVCAWCRV